MNTDNNQTGTIISISVAGVSGLLSILLTVFLIYRHLKHWTRPEAQTYIVRILFMVPVYSLSSFLSLLTPRHTIYFNLVRDCYEAFALYQFFSLLVYYFDESQRETQDNDASTADYLAVFPSFYHPFPCCCLPEIFPGAGFYRTVKQCIMQYVVVKPCMALIAIILESFGLYEEGSTSLDRAYVWITLIVNLSIALALYSLLLFYDTIVDAIEENYRPLYQLAAIKLLIFFIFWQSLIIDALYYFRVMPRFFEIAGHDILSNCLVCLEMFLLSLANLWIFHYAIYRSSDGSRSSLRLIVRNFTKRILNPSDIITDAKDAWCCARPVEG